MSLKKQVYITQEIHFCAAHRLFNTALSAEDNSALFSPCDRIHGHNYKLIVALKGPVDEKTGMLINFRDVRQIMTEQVHDRLDHRLLNDDIPEFKTLLPTTENMAFVIWDWLKPFFGELLYEVALQETEKNAVYYRGEVA